MNNDTKTMRPDITPDIAHALAELEIVDICAEHRDGDGVRSMVYLRNQGQIIDIDTCRTPELLAAAVAHLERELEETRRALEKARRRAASLENLGLSRAPGEGERGLRPRLTHRQQGTFSPFH